MPIPPSPSHALPIGSRLAKLWISPLTFGDLFGLFGQGTIFLDLTIWKSGWLRMFDFSLVKLIRHSLVLYVFNPWFNMAVLMTIN